jgi:hypothetical protein
MMADFCWMLRRDVTKKKEHTTDNQFKDAIFIRNKKFR